MTDNRPVLDTTPEFTIDTPRPIPGPWDRPDCQRIWLGTQVQSWRTLAVVPGDEDLSSYEIASLIMALGLHHGEPIGVADLRDIGLSKVRASLDVVGFHVERGERVVLATSAITSNLATIALARAADAAVLCVAFGSTSLALVKETIEQIGKEHFIGSLLLHKSGPRRRSRGSRRQTIQVQEQ